MGYVYRPKLKSGQPCAVWWAKYYVKGRCIRRSTRTESHADVQRKLKRWEAAPRRRELDEDRVRFQELTALYLVDYRDNGRRSLDHAETYAERLTERFGGRRAVDITTGDMRAYVADRRAAKVANATINRELSALRRMYSLAVEGELLTAAAAPTIKK